jgi:hypothetical protein
MKKEDKQNSRALLIKKSAILNAFESLFLGLLIIVIILLLMDRLLFLIHDIWGIVLPFSSEGLSLVVSISVAMGLAFFLYYRNREDQEEIESKKQNDLLESLCTELDAIGSKKNEFKILNKKISTKGNLEWFYELFKDGLKPGHGIWKLNPQLYVIGLNGKINGKKTKPLKDAIIHLNQKIELIENYLVQYDKIPEGASFRVHREAVKNGVMNLIDDTIDLVRIIKKFIKKEFKI